LHAALRKVLGTHVAQRGSLVAPDRLRFDFSHTAPMTPEEIEAVQREVNEAIWADHPVRWEISTKEAAVAKGAMALFGEKYGDEVRMVEIPGVSLELCGGTHLRHTGEAGSFLIVSESGVASGVRRIEALTGKGAFDRLRGAEEELDMLAAKLRTVRENLPKRLDDLLRERGELEGLLDELRRSGGGSQTAPLIDATLALPGGGEAHYRGIRMRVRDSEDARAFGDAFRESEKMSVAVVAAESGDGRPALYVFVTDDLVGKGVRAGSLIRDITAVVGGKGGGKPHMAQGGIEDPSRVEEALRVGESVLRQAMEGGAA
jgi:alanyl-tRNA synthetase